LPSPHPPCAFCYARVLQPPDFRDLRELQSSAQRCERPTLVTLSTCSRSIYPIAVLAPALEYFIPAGLSAATKATTFSVVSAISLVAGAYHDSTKLIGLFSARATARLEHEALQLETVDRYIVRRAQRLVIKILPCEIGAQELAHLGDELAVPRVDEVGPARQYLGLRPVPRHNRRLARIVRYGQRREFDIDRRQAGRHYREKMVLAESCELITRRTRSISTVTPNGGSAVTLTSRPPTSMRAGSE